MAAEKTVAELELKVTETGVQQATRSLGELEKAQIGVARQLDLTARKVDPLSKAMAEAEKYQRLLTRAQQQGLEGSRAYNVVAEQLARTQKTLAQAHNDNAKAVGLNRMQMMELAHVSRSLFDSMAAGQSPIRAVGMELGRVSQIAASGQGGLGGLLKSLSAIFTPGRLAAGGIVGGLLAMEAAATKTHESLAKVAGDAARTGFSASSIIRAGVIGAGAGVGDMGGAMSTAGHAFEQYKRNTGDVLELLKKFDASFLKVADSAKSADDWVAKIIDEIRKLPSEQGLNLAQALFGQDEGRALFKNIGGLAGAFSDAKSPINEAAKAAKEMDDKIAEAAKRADSELLIAFQKLGSPIEELKLGWYGVVEAIAQAIQKSEGLQKFFWGFTHPLAAIMGGQPEPGGAAGATQLPPISIGGTRRTYAGYGAKSSRGGSSAEDNYTKITRELEQQIRLASAIGDEHKKIQEAIDKENWLAKLGKDTSVEHRDHVAELADKLNAAKEAQDKLNESAKGFNEAYNHIGQTVSGALKDLVHGGKPGDVLKKFGSGFGDNMLDAALTGSGPFAKMFKMEGKDGAMGGLFGGLAQLITGGKNVGSMDVKAGVVNVAGASSDLIGKAGKALGGLFPGAGSSDSAAADSGGGFFSGIGDWFANTFKFADGGIMTSHGALPLRRYAAGGIANSPQLALFGEGSGPEAYVPLRDGRTIPVSMQGMGGGARVTVNNHHGGAHVEARQLSSGEVEILVNRRINQAMAKVPSMLADHMRRQA
ncbi:hypothetical protein WOC76_11150 [Methylocystis sp. IM3]|uniref:hypothetical protein n=1 Tax=unclassified Methylocystis TaxID=2625913 RepID=UPI0030FB405A